jgi:hypothetical protein
MHPRRFWKCPFKSLQMLVANTERGIKDRNGNEFCYTLSILGAFAKLRKATVSLVMSVGLSVRLTVRLSMRLTVCLSIRVSAWNK